MKTSKNIWIDETWIEVKNPNQENEKRISRGESGLYETFTDKIKTLFLSLSREYGKCISSIYIDTKKGKTKKIGWVFQKREKYTDCNETYLKETWITLHEKQPKKLIKYFYKEIN